MSTVVLAVRAWVRYLVPFTILSAIVSLPLLWVAFHVPVPEVPPVGAIVRLTWIAAATAWIAQYVLAGGVAPAVRAVASGTPLSQVRALTAGLVGLARAVLPVAVAVAAIAIGSCALVVPGLALLVLLALTGASAERGMPAPLLDSIAAVRRSLRSVVIVVIAIVVADLAIAAVAQLVVTAPLPKKPTKEQLAAYAQLPRVIALALAAASPVAASLLAALRTRA